MPHFPALNIRTSGINKLMSGYKQIIGKSNDRLTDGNNVDMEKRSEVGSLSCRYDEHQYHERGVQGSREKFDKVRMRETDPAKKCEESLMAVPVIDRSVEKYINPQ